MGSQALRTAGYKAKNDHVAAVDAYQLLRKKDIQTVINGLLEAYKLTPEYAGLKLYEGINASETRFFPHEGQVISEREVLDYRTRAIYLDMLFKLLGSYKTPPPEVPATGVIVLPKQEIHVTIHVKNRDASDTRDPLGTPSRAAD